MGMARRVEARRGTVPGKAGRGRARSGKVRIMDGRAWRVQVRRSRAGRGKDRDTARCGEVVRGKARFQVGLGQVRRGCARRGLRHGSARQGRA
jgi:hypothetical protein